MRYDNFSWKASKGFPVITRNVLVDSDVRQEVAFLRELAALTLEIVSVALLGDAAASAMDDLFKLVPTFTSCLVSLPLRLPWPLSRIQLLSYGRGLATRKKLLKVRGLLTAD